MQRSFVSQGSAKPGTTQVAALLILGALLVFVPGLRAAGRSSDGDGEASTAGRATITGVVRDVQGVAQMGALVQVLAGNSMTVATAFTDQHGRYHIANLAAGKYLVRASATLYVPVQRANLQLRNGAAAVVNLTLAALYDTAAWLPARRRRAEETEDDWKWTLRSTANRPVLRIVEDGSAIEVSSSASEAPVALRIRARDSVESGDGGFGHGGVHNIVAIHEGLEDGSGVLLRADLGTSAGPGAGRAGMDLDAGYEGKTGFPGGASRTVLSYDLHPELVTGGASASAAGTGMQVLTMSSAQRMSLGDRIELEAGGRMEAVTEGTTVLGSQPFLRVSLHPAGAWTLEYRMTGDRGLQEFDDVTSGEGDVPVALVRDGKLSLESGWHQELSAGHRSAGASVQVSVYHDAFSRAAIAGGQAGSAAPRTGSGAGAVPMAIPAGLLLDPTTGSFRALAGGYTSAGTRISASGALTPALWLAAEYSTGEALESGSNLTGRQPPGVEQALASLRVRHAQTATLALKGKLLGSGTRVRASYRWQPVRGVTAVDAYSAFADQAYLSCLIRQPIRAGRLLPQGLEATIDVTNLLAEGYRPFLSADGQTLYFAQAPRTIQAGLSFNF